MNLELRKSELEKIHEAAQLMQRKSSFDMIMITLSEQGLLLSTDGNYRVIPAQTREVSDVSGAGDTVIAMASLCLAVGLDPYQMAELSNLAAGLVIERIGVVPVEKEWLLEASC
jgi:bifunctional ADP-heptose synthase (sugar kinase/adenylyltransferase)